MEQGPGRRGSTSALAASLQAPAPESESPVGDGSAGRTSMRRAPPTGETGHFTPISLGVQTFGDGAVPTPALTYTSRGIGVLSGAETGWVGNTGSGPSMFPSAHSIGAPGPMQAPFMGAVANQPGVIATAYAPPPHTPGTGQSAC